MGRTSLNIPIEKCKYKAMIGTGGIGAGSFFLLSGNHTLGREESRGGKYIDARDYCKLHIIAHNVKMLMGSDFPVYPLGMIGDDDIGRSIFREMEQTGLEMKYVACSPGDRTLFGFCFLYPDGTGGNLTTEESACTRVDPAFIETAEFLFKKLEGKFVSLSAPEVSLDARNKLLELTSEYNGFSVASFTSGEIIEAENKGMLGLVDLLAMNRDEASALTGMDAEHSNPQNIVESAINKMKKINSSAMLSITSGKLGSWSWDATNLSFIPGFPVEVKSSAGAGDAHVSGIIAGLTSGLTLSQAQYLANLAGALSVTSPHTIHPEMHKNNLRKLAISSNLPIDPSVWKLLDD